jgi:hypothetical protein
LFKARKRVILLTQGKRRSFDAANFDEKQGSEQFLMKYEAALTEKNKRGIFDEAQKNSGVSRRNLRQSKSLQ